MKDFSKYSLCSVFLSYGTEKKDPLTLLWDVTYLFKKKKRRKDCDGSFKLFNTLHKRERGQRIVFTKTLVT